MYVKEKSWKIFDEIYVTYDRINQILSFGQDRSWRRFVAKHLPTSSSLRLLDLASGTCDQLIACMESSAQIESAIALDLSANMLEIGRKKLQSKPYRNQVEIVIGDAQSPPFPDSFFDAITFSFGIRNLNDPIRGLQEIKRLLKPQGKALILEFSLPKNPIRPFHLLYLRYILPHIGTLLSKNKEAYRYLHTTIEAFPYGNAFCSMMHDAGFASVQSIPLALGAVTLYVGSTIPAYTLRY
ncbi:MAG: bifunctional demethylmenaquinone methyltransferase/2-methoxy-6-polyprenyl-1,4-benzoquinol methylase UbiE [Chlamydiia bacterium]|nr:bifunctional demethylmenaquinone methyltransferase/2-methoxy-6-polyprenyl-1,4-benzoquinol methylase UbiE [Chlamydiia bacterium]